MSRKAIIWICYAIYAPLAFSFGLSTFMYVLENGTLKGSIPEVAGWLFVGITSMVVWASSLFSAMIIDLYIIPKLCSKE